MSGASGKTDDHDDNDPEAAARHARRLQMRRERAAHAAEEDSYGYVQEGKRIQIIDPMPHRAHGFK